MSILQNKNNTDLFDRMVKAFDISPTALSNEALGEQIDRAREKCSRCAKRQLCQNWLDAETALPIPPDFCPNKALLRSIESE